MTATKCERCNQTAFEEVRKDWRGTMVCPSCYEYLYQEGFNWENEKLAIKFRLAYCGEEFTSYLPMVKNIEAENLEFDHERVLDAFKELKRKWMSEKWGFYGTVIDMEPVFMDEVMPEMTNFDTREDSEFWDVYGYDELMIDPEFYDSPFDDCSADYKFINWFAADCMEGRVYTKDFSYYHCDSCERTVCGQNPSNGWHSQVHSHDGWVECNRCYEERVLKDGINEDFDDDLPGQFFDSTEIEEAGWILHTDYTMVGHGHTGYRDPSGTIEMVRQLIESGKKVLINYQSMAIGGMGGYVDIYTK